MSNFIISRLSNQIAVLTINRESENNSLTPALMIELTALLKAIDAEATIHALIITGAGEKYFATGDVDENDFETLGHLVSALTLLSKPVIAGINGLASGVGADLALCSHLRIAVRNSVFEHARSARLTAWAQAGIRRSHQGDPLQFYQSGALNVPEADALGFLNQVVETQADLLPACQTLAEKICENAPLAVKFALAAVNRPLFHTLEEAMFLETTLFSLCFATEDAREGIRAFLEKRPPQFTGR